MKTNERILERTSPNLIESKLLNLKAKYVI